MKTITKKQFATFSSRGAYDLNRKAVNKGLKRLIGHAVRSHDGFGPYTIVEDGATVDGEHIGNNVADALLGWIMKQPELEDLVRDLVFCEFDSVSEILDWHGIGVELNLPAPRLDNRQTKIAAKYAKKEMGWKKRDRVVVSTYHISDEALVLFANDCCLVVNGSEVVNETDISDFLRNI